MNTTQQKIRAAIDEAVHASLPELGEVDYNAALTSDIGLDSVQVMDLVMEIEDRLDLSIPIELLAETQTLADLATRLEPLLESN